MRTLHRSCFALASLLSVLAGSAARAVTVEQIPTPRPTGWAVDMTHTLPPERLAELNRLGDDLKAKTGAEMAVVVVGSTDGADPHDFATRLFNAWSLGEAGKENGLLVFAALADHKAEIILGHGLDTATGRRESALVMQQEMIPRFRNGDPSGAVVLGAIACARRILGVSPLTAEVETVPGIAGAPQPEPSTYVPSQAPQYAYQPSPEPQTGTGAAYLIGLGSLGFCAIIVGLTLFRTPRCSKCKQKMVKLDEQADDAYLEPSEKVEERIGSIDYQIWTCPTCGEQKKRRVSVFASGYGTCPKCSAKTLRSESTTILNASYSYGGEIQVDETCANCSYQNRYIRYTPRLVADTSSSSTSSSGSSFGSFSSSSGSSSSSSISSGSSAGSSNSGFSGGSSSGGGASGSW